MEIIFDSKRHEELFHKLIKKCKRVRADTISVMYLLALACYDEAQASQMFNFESNMTINTFGVFLIFTKE